MTRTLYIISVLTSVFLWTACGDAEKDAKTPSENNVIIQEELRLTQTQFESNEMELGKLSEQEFPSITQATGMIDVPPQNKAVVSTFMGGYIKDTPLLIGDAVKKGQFLVSIENTDFVQIQQEYLEVAEQLSYLKSEFQRQRTLLDENITSQKNYLKAESDYKRALAMYNGLHKKLTMLSIDPANVEAGNITSVVRLYAPISGSITKVNVSRGMYVSPADNILEIINIDHMHLELSVFEKDILKLKKEQEIIFRVPEASNETFKAKVHLVGTAVDENSRTLKVHGHFENDSDLNFAVGMFVEAQIVTNKNMAKALPDEAIVAIDNKSYVLKLDKKTDGTYFFSKNEVKIREEYNGFTRIENTDSFNDTDEFLTKGAFNIISGE
ncbi:efflux RND transporter periplasmic adaptor subunit [Gillisia sp. M10.2A]|uniref:Efflux RND transporter periplasmic adaptor subunit n=1 Tax=Gillisia lutea TaxID=2909668 RepID=A0ABS9EE61_9FLAO|nr:efflux RND transporter periplasmic adaptor subunit [Gillisia lutea]MCF4101141.1 efflux RND transporter periplasmic adaptor subunit [Gillisia lutea]